MIDFNKSLLPPTATVRDAVTAIESSQVKIGLVVDDDRHLLGTVTDGDIRRGVLAGIGMDDAVHLIMNATPVCAGLADGRDHVRALMRNGRLRQVPILDAAGRLVAVETLTHLLEDAGGRRDTAVVLMAGGEGRRLRPLTTDVPKPMLPVGPKPILETIVESFVQAGFRRFYFSVNYKAELVERHFGNGSAFSADITYLRETRPLGTAGSLSLLPDRPSGPFIVMNGDILTRVDYVRMLDFHHEQGGVATMGVRPFDMTIPFGVVDMQGDALVGIVEKPTVSRFVNAGIYVLNPEVLDLVAHDREHNMPQLFEDLLAANRHCAAFPIREYWLDIGRMEEYERANTDFMSVFHG